MQSHVPHMDVSACSDQFPTKECWLIGHYMVYIYFMKKSSPKCNLGCYSNIKLHVDFLNGDNRVSVWKCL